MLRQRAPLIRLCLGQRKGNASSSVHRTVMTVIRDTAQQPFIVTPTVLKKRKTLSLSLPPLNHSPLRLPLRPSRHERRCRSALLLLRAPSGAARLPPSRVFLAPSRRALVAVVHAESYSLVLVN